MKFLRNIWYPALWAKDLHAGELHGRRLLDEAIVFFRRDDGAPAALADACPHRQIPLHLGTLTAGARVQCAYHGLEFDAAGHCVHNPHPGGKITARLCVRAYPLIERHTMIWIWMGDAPPDSSTIPDLRLMDEAADAHSRARDSMTMEANYLLIADNLLDLSHANYLHAGILGFPDRAFADTRNRHAHALCVWHSPSLDPGRHSGTKRSCQHAALRL